LADQKKEKATNVQPAFHTVRAKRFKVGKTTRSQVG